MYREDWLMRQIEGMADVIAQIFFGRKRASFDFEHDTQESKAGIFQDKLKDLLAEGRVNEAENLLFEMLDPNDRLYLALALDFYLTLNSWDDIRLNTCGFPRDEVAMGLSDVLGIYGLSQLEIKTTSKLVVCTDPGGVRTC